MKCSGGQRSWQSRKNTPQARRYTDKRSPQHAIAEVTYLSTSCPRTYIHAYKHTHDAFCFDTSVSASFLRVCHCCCCDRPPARKGDERCPGSLAGSRVEPRAAPLRRSHRSPHQGEAARHHLQGLHGSAPGEDGEHAGLQRRGGGERCVRVCVRMRRMCVCDKSRVFVRIVGWVCCATTPQSRRHCFQ